MKKEYILVAERNDLVVFLLANRHVAHLLHTSSPTIPRGHKYVFHLLALGKLPGNRVLATTSTNHKNVGHFSKRLYGYNQQIKKRAYTTTRNNDKDLWERGYNATNNLTCRKIEITTIVTQGAFSFQQVSIYQDALKWKRASNNGNNKQDIRIH